MIDQTPSHLLLIDPLSSKRSTLDDSLAMSKWTAYFGVMCFWVLGALVSFLMAIVSINVVVIHLFLWGNIFCLVLAIKMVSRNKVLSAYFFTIAPAPVGFLLALLYLYSLPFWNS